VDASNARISVKRIFSPVISVLSWVGDVFVSLLLIALFVSVLYFTGAREVWLWLNAMTWEQTQCEIDQVYSGRQESSEAGSTSVNISFRVSASYRYRNDFGTFMGNRYDFKGIFRSSYQSVKQDLNYLRKNNLVACYYNPRKPDQSVINRGFQWDFLIILLPMLTLGPFAYMALHSLLKKLGIKKLMRPKQRGFLP